jgi:hypothetical protein
MQNSPGCDKKDELMAVSGLPWRILVGHGWACPEGDWSIEQSHKREGPKRRLPTLPAVGRPLWSPQFAQRLPSATGRPQESPLPDRGDVADHHLIVGMTNSAPSLVPEGQRDVTVLVFV